MIRTRAVLLIMFIHAMSREPDGHNQSPTDR